MLSDAAGAMLLSARPNRTGLSLRIDWIDLFSYANEQPACMYMGAEKDASGRLTGWQRYSQEDLLNRSVLAVKQDVKQLNAHIIHYGLERPLKETMARRGLAAAGIDWFLAAHVVGIFS